MAWRFIIIFFISVVVQGIALAGNGHKYKYAYSGYEGNGARRSSLQFNIRADGIVSGVMTISNVCESNIHMAGGKLSFTAHLTGSYPQATGTFHGTTVPACGGRGRPTSGIIKIGYHPQFGVFVQLFNSAGGGGTEWYHKKPLHGSPRNPFE